MLFPIKAPLTQFGFKSGISGVHLCRTMMLKELVTLLRIISNPKASLAEYRSAIEDDNCLDKKSAKARTLTRVHLADLYALDDSVVLFRALRYFWARDNQSLPLLALLCAYARDGVLRQSAPFILNLKPGTAVVRQDMENYIESLKPDRFSSATLKSVAQNLNGTWTFSGHLHGKVTKIRSCVRATESAVCYALLMGYLRGVRGVNLFHTEYLHLIECSHQTALELANSAGRKGMIIFKRIGNIVEVLFPNLVTDEELAGIHEQN